MVVMKFGGTSVADQAAIERLMAIVARQREKDAAAGDAAPGPVVVVSALSGVTDRLLAVAAEAGAGDADGARHSLRALRERHMTVSAVVADEAQRQGWTLPEADWRRLLALDVELNAQGLDVWLMGR